MPCCCLSFSLCSQLVKRHTSRAFSLTLPWLQKSVLLTELKTTHLHSAFLAGSHTWCRIWSPILAVAFLLIGFCSPQASLLGLLFKHSESYSVQGVFLACSRHSSMECSLPALFSLQSLPWPLFELSLCPTACLFLLSHMFHITWPLFFPPWRGC